MYFENVNVNLSGLVVQNGSLIYQVYQVSDMAAHKIDLIAAEPCSWRMVMGMLFDCGEIAGHWDTAVHRRSKWPGQRRFSSPHDS